MSERTDAILETIDDSIRNVDRLRRQEALGTDTWYRYDREMALLMRIEKAVTKEVEQHKKSLQRRFKQPHDVTKGEGGE